MDSCIGSPTVRFSSAWAIDIVVHSYPIRNKHIVDQRHSSLGPVVGKIGNLCSCSHPAKILLSLLLPLCQNFTLALSLAPTLSKFCSRSCSEQEQSNCTALFRTRRPLRSRRLPKARAYSPAQDTIHSLSVAAELLGLGARFARTSFQSLAAMHNMPCVGVPPLAFGTRRSLRSRLVPKGRDYAPTPLPRLFSNFSNVKHQCKKPCGQTDKHPHKPFPLGSL